MAAGENEDFARGLWPEAMERSRKMGFYLNSRTAYALFENEVRQPYFVDKSEMLEELIPLVKAGNRHICLTRPRRF